MRERGIWSVLHHNHNMAIQYSRCPIFIFFLLRYATLFFDGNGTTSVNLGFVPGSLRLNYQQKWTFSIFIRFGSSIWFLQLYSLVLFLKGKSQLQKELKIWLRQAFFGGSRGTGWACGYNCFLRVLNSHWSFPTRSYAVIYILKCNLLLPKTSLTKLTVVSNTIYLSSLFGRWLECYYPPYRK